MNLTIERQSVRVIARFGVRMAILVFFATFGSIGFARSLAALLCMSAILSAVLAAIKREGVLDRSLNHWHEMTAYVALCCLIVSFDGFAVPI